MLTRRVKTIQTKLFLKKVTIGICGILVLLSVTATAQDHAAAIDRKALVQRHNPCLDRLDPTSPFTVGNGHFAFTADVTGFQSLARQYFEKGIPLETKARWAWHSRENRKGYTLSDASKEFNAYGRKVKFPTDIESKAGQWFRKNPHDLPLVRIALNLDRKNISEKQLIDIGQTLDLWSGELTSAYKLEGAPMLVDTVSHGNSDVVAFRVHSGLLNSGRLGIGFAFPRGYDPAVKNTPDLVWSHDDEHITRLIQSDDHSALIYRRIDDAEHWLRLHWRGRARLMQNGKHRYRLDLQGQAHGSNVFELSVEFFQSKPGKGTVIGFDEVRASSRSEWIKYWNSGAAIDFSGSRDPRARELERRVVLSQYLLGVQARSAIPAQETGLTSSSWYGKHHTEMAWWHSAHWVLWGRGENTERVLYWYIQNLDRAKKIARERGLQGARWPKMVGPVARESPGGNPLIIWNQPQPVHLAEMLYRANPDKAVLQRYGELVEETAKCLSSMLVWDEKQRRYSLEPPIWIAQEIYDPVHTRNPAFELSYWRFALQTALKWRQRSGKKENPLWREQIDKLAGLPQKGGRYVAIESIPDTFDNFESRRDHPTLLASWGLLNDDRVDQTVMRNTLKAVLTRWDWKEKIWGWDYPMIAMTALKLDDPATALDILLKDAPHNRYLINGHCPQPGAGLPVYLPANGALLAAVERLTVSGFPENGSWSVRSEGFK